MVHVNPNLHQFGEKMNTFVIFTLCIVAFAAAHPVQDEISNETKAMAAQNKDCIEQTGITLEQLEKLSTSPTADMPKPGMCYIKCVAELGGLEKDGVIQKDLTVAKRPEGFSKADAEKAVDECGKLVADDPCETSFTRYICIFERGERRAWLKAE